MPIAILDPFSGISGDMTLGALIAVGLDPEWLRALPGTLGLDGVTVQISNVQRAGIGAVKVDFDIPPQPHGRHLKAIRKIVAESGAPDTVREKADRAFTGIASAEAEIHGTDIEKVHLHEVGAVDAILDVVGSIWGFELLGVHAIHCGPIRLGDGSVRAAHGELPVPAPATLKLLEGHPVRPGPEGAGELVTPTGAALVRVLSSGPPPTEFTPLRSGYGAGTKDPKDRPNSLRLTLAEVTGRGDVEEIVLLTADLDDLTGEHVAAATEAIRSAGALDVIVLPTMMKKGRPGTRIEAIAPPASAAAVESAFLRETTTLGVRRVRAERRILQRTLESVSVLGHDIAVKVASHEDGRRSLKPEHDDVQRVARNTGRTVQDIFALAVQAGEHLARGGGSK